MSKRILHHPEVPADESTVAWRSVGQLEDTPDFREWMDREFPRGAAELADATAESETSRRSFLKLMGASTALAGFGMAACRRPEAYIVPYTRAPEWVIPGNATYYASCMPRAFGATPLVVKTFEGRPTVVAPNERHPDTEGTDAFAQASVLDLYSPWRSRQILKAGKSAPAGALEAQLAALAADTTAKIGFVFGADDSPTRARLRTELAAKYPAARFYQYEALAGEGPTVALGDGVRTVANFSQADRIVSLDCDFVGTDPQGPVTPFFTRRKPETRGYDSPPSVDFMNRLYAVESAYSLTGGMADHRLRVSPSQVNAVAAQIARRLGVNIAVAAVVPELTDPKHIAWVDGLVEDLKANPGRSAIIAGSRQSVSVHLIAHAINLALGNIGDGKPLVAMQTGNQELGNIVELMAAVDAGEVEHLVLMTPSNPVYDTPADLNFAGVFPRLKTSIHLGMRTDATAHAAGWHVPAAHYLESWGDARSAHGVYSIVQPMILPLYPDCVSELELLLALLAPEGKLVRGDNADGSASPGYAAVRTTFAGLGGEGEAAWKQLLREGFLEGSAYPVVNPPSRGDISVPLVGTPPSVDSLEVIFATDYSVWDGRWIDNGWLQEAPDPIAKHTWDNAVLIAPETAKNLGIYNAIVELETTFASKSVDGEGENRRVPLVKIEVNGRSLVIPALLSFGQAENTLVVPLGYGQGFNEHNELGLPVQNLTHVGPVGVNAGVNAYPLRTRETSYFATGAKLTPTTERYHMALTQEHGSMYGRALAREVSTLPSPEKGSFEQQLANVPKQGNDSHAPPNISLYKPEDRQGQTYISDPLHQWAMAIDLSACSGCNACLVACQAENNIPIVGKEQVARGREMHWIRMDRYYAVQKDNTFDANNPALIPQPVACQHCDLAPCETVCPVNATVHTEDGLNAMAYNRCIGTRYCANNCPYKVRRFNYFDYNKRNPLLHKNLYKGPLGETQVGEGKHLQHNPNVTVRMRGVMEKCTYCVQRLKDAVIRQKRAQKHQVAEAGVPSPELQVTTETLRIPVDSVKVACQEACPAEAITFGNLHDELAANVVRAKSIDRSYDLLNYLNTRPRTSYLARVKNPNAAMPDAPFIGKATINMV